MRSLKLTPGKARQLASALDLIEAHIAPAAEVWGALTDEQRDALLAHSPVLARLIDLGGRFDAWQR